MTQRGESFLDKVVWPLLVLGLTPTVTLLGSKVQSGNWLSWMQAIPSWAYGTFFASVMVWVAVGVIIRRVKHLKERNLPKVIRTISGWGYVTVGKLTHRDVVWLYRIPAPPSWASLTIDTARNSRVSVATPPRCPKCDTELEETETFLGRYRWACLRCGFTRKNGMSYYHEAVRGEKLAQSEWEKVSREKTE